MLNFSIGTQVKRFYLIAAIIGAIAPYATYFGYLAAYPGASGALSLAWGSAISAATLVDFTISCLVFWPFVFMESQRLTIKWPPLFIISNVLIGLSFALPLFLYCREAALEKNLK
jgi:Terpene cyclase DEP1